MRIALGLEYDGTRFAGWQTQPASHQVATLQDRLELAVSKIADTPTSVVCAGRTDAGVHALQQIIHFDTEAQRPTQAWLRGVNALLPSSMSVRWAQNVPHDFHARHHAFARRYTYVLTSNRVRPALAQAHTGWTHLPLRFETMQQAAALLLGEHDFSTFRASECQARSPVRIIESIEIVPRGNTFFITIQANAFLHHMMRNIVGALVYVGCGRWSLAQFADTFAACDRTQGAPTFSASGLYFCGAKYDAAHGIPAPIEVNSENAWPWAL